MGYLSLCSPIRLSNSSLIPTTQTLARALFQSITPDNLKGYECSDLTPLYRHAMLLVHPDKNSHLNYWEATMASVHLNNAIETVCKK